MNEGERGQASIEWVALVLLAALALGALAAFVPRVDGRSLGSALARVLTCAVTRSCAAERDALVAAYGERDAALVRRFAPGLVYEPGTGDVPVDWRECRARSCSLARDERGLDTTRSRAGLRATAFTHVARSGGYTYLQYWLYYPDSNTTWLASDKLWAIATSPARLVSRAPRYPGYHRDDWEGVEVRVASDGRAAIRATAHGGWRWCKQRRCEGMFGPDTGWSRVSRGSHAGHIPLEGDEPLYPGTGLDERTTAAAGLRLIPLETLRERDDVFPEISPPWRKRAWNDPGGPHS